MNFNAVTAILLTELFVLVASSCVIIIRFRELQRVETKSASDIGYIVASSIWIFSLTAHTASMLVYPESAHHISAMDALAWIGFCFGTLILLFLQLENNDIRSLKGAQNKEGSADEVYRRIVDDGPACFIVIDAEHYIEDANLSATKLLGKNKERLTSLPFSEFVLEDDHPILSQLKADELTTRYDGNSYEVRLAIEDNEPRWVMIAPQLLDARQKSILILLQDISETKSLSELLNFHSQYDELTMLHNRTGLENYLVDALRTTQGRHISISLIYIDIDQLKVVNDTCGHTAGDNLIQQLVSIISDAAQSFDFFARLAGDEFALVKQGCDETTAKNLAESIRSAAEDFVFTWKNNHYRQSVSIGVATSSPTSLNDVVSLIGAADSACYTAKKNGRNRVVMYANNAAETSYDSHKEVMWVSRLQKAIQDGAFALYFQPIEKLEDETHIHYELLIRYIDENGKHIGPDNFLPAVERFGLSEQIDLWVLTTALDYLDKHPEHTEMLNCCSINLTTQSISNPRIRSAILQVVQSYNFPRDKICFEITESSAIHNLREAQEFVKELKTLGCHLALDDFGTGFASFDYLKNLAVDYIKIDGSFVKDIITDRFDRAMVSAINNIGKEMGIEIIAEYAESDIILDTLHDMGIDYAQGYAIAKPQPIDNIEPYYADKVSFTQKVKTS